MTSRAARAGRAAALLAAAGLLCGGCSLLPGTAASPAAPASTTARPAATASPQPRGSGGAAGLAAAVSPGPAAGRRQPRRAVHRRLGLLVLAAAPRRVAGRGCSRWPPPRWSPPSPRPRATAASWPSATAARQVAVATVTGLAIRDLTPGSVTVTVTAAQVITSSSGTSRSSAGWAVTLTPDGSGWLVWDIEPAGAGNS